jgi:hypothetical protein
MAPEGMKVKQTTVNGAAANDVAPTERYHRPAARVMRTVAPGETLTLEVVCKA